jgi:hypothetical protein
MLLAENAVDKFGNLSSEFPKQVDAMLARLDAVQASRPIPAATAPILDEMFRRAHERLLLTQVAREIQVNLRHMEQVLDAFFRNHAKRAELATLSKDSQQIRGALKMLGQDDAERLLGLCQQQIDSYGAPTRRSTVTTSSFSPNRFRAGLLHRSDGAAAAGSTAADRAAPRETSWRSARRGCRPPRRYRRARSRGDAQCVACASRRSATRARRRRRTQDAQVTAHRSR